MDLRQGSPLYKLKLVDRTILWELGLPGIGSLVPQDVQTFPARVDVAAPVPGTGMHRYMSR
jgi:hypothetical protein